MSPLPPNLVNVILIAWSGAGQDARSLKKTLTDAVQALLARVPAVEDESPEDPLTGFARHLVADSDNLRVLYVRKNPEVVEVEVERAISEGASQVIVMPLVFAMEEGNFGELSLSDLLPHFDRMEANHPHVEIFFIGPPFGQVSRLERLIRRIRQKEPQGAQLLEGFVARGFRGDWSRFGRFMAVLQSALPPGTRIAARGSSVSGYGFSTGLPFDADGNGSSDLDLVLVGEEVMERWSKDGFYIPGILTMPLEDANAHFAPWLDDTRKELESIAGRPVHIQAMAQWFLDLRAALLNTEYVFLDA